MKIEKLELDRIIPYARNARQHSDAQVAQIAASIHEFGFNSPILIDENNVIIAGHGRYAAAQKLQLDEVPVIRLEHLSDIQKKAYILADNKLALNASWDDAMLALELAEIKAGDLDIALAGFTDEELSAAQAGGGEAPGEEVAEGKTEPDAVPEKVEPMVKPGEIWQLGSHRLMCGDSTDGGAVALLMGEDRADLVTTDPPYNVAIGSKNAFLNEFQEAGRVVTDIKGDKGMTDEECGEKLWKPAFANMRLFAKDNCSIYVTMPQGGAHMMMMMMMMRASWQVKHELIWLKNAPTFSMGRLNYDYKHEPFVFGWADSHKFYGAGHCKTSIWEFDKPRKCDLHPTMKPVELIVEMILNSSLKGHIVLDLFGGSGTTLIACEQTGRKARLMELDPHYCDVIIRRWENFTGQKAVKEA